MTIEFKIGSFYRTREGRKIKLLAISSCGQMAFEAEEGEIVIRYHGGVFLRGDTRAHSKDIVSEWREPHVHECEVWVREHAGVWGVPSEIFNFPVGTWSTTQLSESRKFKVRVEEVIE